MHADRRSTLKLLGGAALTTAVLPVLPFFAMAQEDLYVSVDLPELQARHDP